MSSILIHQALHGYSDGHRLISSSLPLEHSDARVMLVMSDLSGPGMKPSERGYLTGYPLEQSGRYVLARTWGAPEMSRPGCVWTHSLIIENADLAKLVSAQTLLETFTRPTSLDFRLAYGSPVSVTLPHKPNEIASTERAEFLLAALYEFPSRQVVANASEPIADEEVITAIWMQQWPRLRRSFGFCTLAGMDRSGKGIVLDLQFVPEADRQVRSKFPSALFADGTSNAENLLPLLADLGAPSLSTLREFLKRTGGDVDGGRRAMLPLCELHRSLLECQPPDLVSAVSALTALDTGGRKQARSIRMLITRLALKSPGRIEDEVFEFLIRTLEHPVEQDEIALKLGVELWRRSLGRFHSALISQGELARITSLALEGMESEQIVSGLALNPEIAFDIVQRRPDIMMLSSFWSIPEIDDALAENISKEDAGLAAQALLVAGRSAPAVTIINKADPADLIRALEMDHASQGAVENWIAILSRELDKLASVLASEQVKRLSTVVAIARQTSPDDVPNYYGDDPWIIALRSSSGQIVESDQDFLAAFFLNRALGWKSRSQGELLQYSYARVYRAFKNQRFSHDTGKLASMRLVKGAWFEWDNCSRLRETVAKKFVENNLDPEIFSQITDDVPLALDLIDEVASTKKGRNYLSRVYVVFKRLSESQKRSSSDNTDDG